MDAEKELKSLLKNLPNTPKSLRKAEALVRFLKADERGLAKIEVIEHGIFDDVIPDMELSARAHNLYQFIKTQHNLTTFNDLELLYFKVLTVIKQILLSRAYFRSAITIDKFNKELHPKEIQYLANLQRIDSWLSNLHLQYQKELSISRDKRMAKVLRTQDSEGNSLVMLLSNIVEEKNVQEEKKDTEIEIAKRKRSKSVVIK